MSRPMSSISPTHSPTPWCPSPDDPNIPRTTIAQLPFPLLPQSTTASQKFRSTPISSGPASSSVTSSRLSSPSASPSTSGRIARPPNAFLLFRSHFLKQYAALHRAESRQRILSCFAGQSWKTMGPTEKQIWYNKAKREAVMHRERYPNYKFTPAPRRLSAAKNNGKLTVKISQLNKTYAPLKGPAPPSRNRRPKKARNVEVGNRFPSTSRHPIIKVATPTHTPFTFPLSLPSQAPSLMQALPPVISSQPILPRPPSTSLGLDHCEEDEKLAFAIDQDDNNSYLIHNQNTFAARPQAFQNLESSSFSTDPFNTALCNPPGSYQQSPVITVMEAIPPHTLPQQAPLSPNLFSSIAQPQNFAENSAPKPSADDLYYEQLSKMMSAEALPSFGTGEDVIDLVIFNLEDHYHTEVCRYMDELMTGPNYFFSDAEAIARWNLIGGIDLPNSDNVIYEFGDLSCFENFTACLSSNTHHT